MSNTPDPKPMEILLVEDDKFHVTMAKKYLNRSAFNYKLTTVNDGEDALDFLYRRGPFTNASRPDIILLDLGLPKVSGRDVLIQMQKDPNLNQIPVLILTASDDEINLEEFTGIPRKCIFSKWTDMKNFTTLVKSVQDFRSTFSKKTDQEAA